MGGLKKGGSRNPVMLLDEVDKLGTDYRGDPAAALLEVLDPEQNNTFTDHYIDVPFDLSQVLFIATANRWDTIPGALLDRMEVIELPGYTREEKRAIAKQFLVPKQLSEHGLTPERLDVTDEAIDKVVDEYTHEAGVRKLEQQVAAMCRAVAVRFASGEDVHIVAGSDFVREVLGPERHERQHAERTAAAGVAAGLAWTPAGGELMLVEASRMPGTGQVHLTGQMGDVMKESVAAAFTYIRARANKLGLPEEFLSKLDIHVHLPQGGVPKEGPSAGIAIFVALLSMLTRVKVRPDVAMTGEITLRGSVLRVGGIKEKCLAAHRAGIKHVILPKRNEPDLDELRPRSGRTSTSTSSRASTRWQPSCSSRRRSSRPRSRRPRPSERPKHDAVSAASLGKGCNLLAARCRPRYIARGRDQASPQAAFHAHRSPRRSARRPGDDRLASARRQRCGKRAPARDRAAAVRGRRRRAPRRLLAARWRRHVGRDRPRRGRDDRPDRARGAGPGAHPRRASHP